MRKPIQPSQMDFHIKSVYPPIQQSIFFPFLFPLSSVRPPSLPFSETQARSTNSPYPGIINQPGSTHKLHRSKPLGGDSYGAINDGKDARQQQEPDGDGDGVDGRDEDEALAEACACFAPKVLIYAVGGVGGTGLAWVRFGGWFVVVGEIGD